ncbi:MAG: hypothetical protein AAGA54_02235 [Myxococcota bacterium]
MNASKTVVASAGYEFSPKENATITRTSRWAKALAVMFFIDLVVQIIDLNILGILVDLAVALTFWRGATMFDAVVSTEGEDVPTMLEALEQMQTAFTIRIIVTLIATAIGLLVGIGFFVQYKFLHDASASEPEVRVEDVDAPLAGQAAERPDGEHDAAEGQPAAK